MADQNTAPDPGTDGQAAAPADTATSAAAPTATDGQGTTPAATTTGQAALSAPAVEFYDPKQYDAAIGSLPPEAQAQARALVKQIHSDATRKYQAISQDRELLEQARAFVADPIGNMQQIARQHGYQLTRAQAEAAVQQQQGTPSWDPRSGEPPADWETVLSAAEQRAEQRLMQKFAPVIGNVQKLQAQNIEAQLDGMDPQWRSYEDAMRDNLKKHPTLVNDVGTLYRLSVPQEVIEARATQAAIARLQKTTASARVSGTSTARASSPAPRVVKTFADAVEAAKEQLNART